MNQALSGAAIAAVIAVLWLLGRPRTTILRSTDTSAIAALNRSQMTLVQGASGGEDNGATAPVAPAPRHPWPAAADLRGRRALLLQLERQFQAGGRERQWAMASCGAWGHRAALPLIQRGLRDADPQVSRLAAAAMDRFRGRSTAVGPGTAQPAAKPPRNVSRTR
jgi:hypothetical protein